MATQSAARRARLTQFATDLCLTNVRDELNVVNSTDGDRTGRSMRRYLYIGIGIEIARKAVIVIPAVTVLCLIALLMAQGRLFPDFVARSQWAKPVGDGCFYMSMPGGIVAAAIWGYSSARTIWSDLVVISVNVILYSTPIILFLMGLRRWRSHQKSA
jgi:hypothetical protein